MGQQLMVNALDEIMWAGYVGHLARTGEVTADSDIAKIKRQFMAGLHGEDDPADECD